MDTIKFEINPIDELKQAVTLLQFPNGNKMVQIKKGQRGSSTLWASCVAMGIKPFVVPADKQ